MTTPPCPARPTSEAGDHSSSSSPVSPHLVGGSAQAPADRLILAQHVIAIDDYLATAIEELAGAVISAVYCRLHLDLAQQHWSVMLGLERLYESLEFSRAALKPLVEAALDEVEAGNEQ